MGIFGDSKTQFDTLVEKVTDEKNTGEDWGIIMTVCDRVGATNTGPKECLKALVRRLNHQDPHVVMQAITLLDACVNNCGRYFMLEVASREFETEFRKLLAKSHPKVGEKLRAMLRRWSEGEFSKDAQYSLIPSLYSALRREGADFHSPEQGVRKAKELPSDPLVVSSQQEEDDLAKAIQLSLQEKGGKAGAAPPPSALYSLEGLAAPAPAPRKEDRRARALYDFEAAEDNELTFQAGEMVVILDDADPNWWKGSNHRGEGLFPSNFVTLDLEGEVRGERKRSVAFNEEVEVQEVEQLTFPAQDTIDQGKIESLLSLLHEADPTSGEADNPDMARLEQQVSSMGPLIDSQLEATDRRHAQLTRLSHELVDALSLYHSLMREAPMAPMAPQYSPYGAPHYPPQGPPGAMPPGVMQGPPGAMPPGAMGGPPPMGGYLPPGPPPPSYYQDPALYQQQGYPAPPGGVIGSAPPPTPPLQADQQGR